MKTIGDIMPIEYHFLCKHCGFEKNLKGGSFFTPFDSCGKMWTYRIYACNHCGNLENRYLPTSSTHVCFCKTCKNAMNPVLYVNDLKTRLCPNCCENSLNIKAHVFRRLRLEQNFQTPANIPVSA